MEEILLILFGLIIGSFLNVVIHRLPIEKSIYKPRSYCPQCNQNIKFYDNIPVISFIILEGKCRSCKAKISLQYPLVEIFTALTFWLSYSFYFSASPVYTVFTIIFLCIIMVLAIIDFKHMILPDELTIGGGVLFLTYSFFNPIITYKNAFISAFGSFLVFALLYFFYLKVRKIEGLGFGDVKMMVLLGAFLGIHKLLIAVFLASLSGIIIGFIFIIFKGKDLKTKLPFGTFLGFGTYISVFWGDNIWRFIQSLSH